MSFNITGGHLAIITFIVMAILGMMWYEYLDSESLPRTDFQACLKDCPGFEYTTDLLCRDKCINAFGNMLLCIETDKEVDK